MNIVSFGGGTNSTAMIIGMYLHKIPIDLILFADTGASSRTPTNLSRHLTAGWRDMDSRRSSPWSTTTRMETG